MALDGILVVAKPAGPTSHDVVAIVRRLSGTRRVGHGGTLDPFASGVLPLFLGAATRIVEYHLGDAKVYRATVCFGAASSTGDLEGELTPAEGHAPDRVAVEGALGIFRGTFRQTPPAYSAVRLGGRRAYAMARAGLTPELSPRTVSIASLELTDWDGSDPDRPIAIVEVACSAGTYVRALARDLGEAVGSAAYLGALVRTASGPFRLADAHSLDEIRAAADPPPLGWRLLPIDTGLERLPRVELSADDLAAIVQGQVIRVPVSADQRAGAAAGGPDDPAGEGGPLRLYGADGRLVAIGVQVGDRIRPEKVLVRLPIVERIDA